MSAPCKKCSTTEGTVRANDMCADCFNAEQAAWTKRMAIRQDPAQFDIDKLVKLLLTQHWQHECIIHPQYMPPFPREDTQPTCVVEYVYPDGSGSTFLRYSRGPLQGYFWDAYGEDFHSPELALLAISYAPAPTRVGVVIPTHGK